MSALQRSALAPGRSRSLAGGAVGLVLVGGVASIPGALIGARLTGRLSEQRLVQAIGAVLLVAGAAAAVQAVV